MLTFDTTTLPQFDFGNPASFKLDLIHPKPKEVLAIDEAFKVAIRKSTHDLGALPVTTGWNEITPEIAVNMLLRNRQNRRIDPATVYYYANQMAAGKWKATGQPILVDANGELADSQHRLIAVLISGATIKSFVVTDIEPIPGLFAYIDNSRPRTAATALQTKGLNGVSATIVKVIKIGEEVRHGVYNPSGASKLPRMSPADILELSDSYPNARQAARVASSDWEEAVTLLGGRKEVIAYIGMRITDLFDEYKADDFFEEIMADTDGRSSDDPILALRKLAEKDARNETQMKKQYMLAAMIKVFNAWHSGQPLGRRWMLQVDENFPDFVENESDTAEAA
jgi:hypothetical protein